ncbi:MAG: glycosyltransferase family 2 protein [Verrucomicrobiota bacterium]
MRDIDPMVQDPDVENLFAVTLSVIVPAFNEARNIAACLRRALREKSVKEIIVVDDASTDTTAAEVEKLTFDEPRIRLERHARNRGKGAALRTSFQVTHDQGRRLIAYERAR